MNHTNHGKDHVSLRSPEKKKTQKKTMILEHCFTNHGICQKVSLQKEELGEQKHDPTPSGWLVPPLIYLSGKPWSNCPQLGSLDFNLELQDLH